MKKLLCLILALTMVLGTMGTVVFAAEPDYVAKLAGTDICFENLADAFTTEYNPENKQVMLLRDYTGDLVINNNRVNVFYLENHTFTGQIKVEFGGLTLYGHTTISQGRGRIENTGINGNYPLCFEGENSNHINISNCDIVATETDGVALYSDSMSAKINLVEKITGENVNITGDVVLEDGFLNIATGNTVDGDFSVTNGTLGISGGTFTTDVKEYILAGKKIVDNGDGTYSVVVDPDAATLADLALEDGVYLIKDAYDFMLFRNLIEAGETGSNVFKLTGEIDLDGYILEGGVDKPRFGGTLDGNGFKIKNVTIDAAGKTCVGLINSLADTGVIKNITLENVSVDGGSFVGGLVGRSRSTSAVDNCKIVGTVDVEGSQHVGALMGNTVNSVTNCSVDATGTVNGSASVGGLVGTLTSVVGEISGNTVTGISVSGNSAVGGIAGNMQPGGVEIENNTVNSVEINGNSSAGLVIGWIYDNGNEMTLLNNAASESALIVDGEESSAIYGDIQSSTTAATKIVALADGKPVGSIAEAIAAGGEITLLDDIATTSAIAIPASKDVVLDLNGYTISGDFQQSAASKVFDVDGKLTVKDSSAEQTGKITSHAANPDTGVIPGYASNTIAVAGTFVLESGTIENMTASGGACYAIDTKWSSAASTNIVINGGTVKAEACAIRLFVNQANVPANLTVNGGKVIGGRGVWIHLPGSANAVKTTNIKVTDGEIIATGRPSGENSAFYVYSYGDSYENVNVEFSGGTFDGDVLFGGGTSNNGSGTETVKITGGNYDGYVYSYNTAVPHKIAISGGTFTENVSEYMAEGFELYRTADGYVAIDETSAEGTATASSISVVYENITEEGVEGEKTYAIVLKSNDGDEINELASADLTFVYTTAPVTGGAIDFTVAPAADFSMTRYETSDRYMFNYSGVNAYEGTESAITVGTITVKGYGAYTIATKQFAETETDTNVVNATTLYDNLVESYTVDGANDKDLTTGALDISAKVDGADATIAVPVRELTITVDFPNAVVDNAAAYQAMKVEITGNIDGVNQTVAYDLGEDGEWKMEDGSYVVTEDRLVLNNAYTVTVSGVGYRTARYTVTMTEDKELRFWNNVMDNAVEVEEGEASSAVKKTFLAGDIVKDNKINIYDLSAVVSYFGEGANVENGYAKYDLNRDGVIDSKDVAYVLVSWGE